MRRLNFSKIKKAFAGFINYFAKFSKKRYSESKVETEENKAPAGNYSKRKGGYKHYAYILKAINGNFPDVFRDFNKQKLTGCTYTNGKRLYRIEKNPHYVFN